MLGLFKDVKTTKNVCGSPIYSFSEPRRPSNMVLLYYIYTVANMHGDVDASVSRPRPHAPGTTS